MLEVVPLYHIGGLGIVLYFSLRNMGFSFSFSFSEGAMVCLRVRFDCITDSHLRLRLLLRGF